MLQLLLTAAVIIIIGSAVVSRIVVGVGVFILIWAVLMGRLQR